jgi:hypothetical protein
MGNKFLVLDAARLKQNLDEAKVLNASCISLYTGEMEAQLENVFPFLFRFDDQPAFADWYFKNGWGQSWGVILYSEYDIQKTADHLKKNILVNTENGKDYFFRFYDPRVLRVFLPTCNTKQLKEFLGPTERFICEDIDPDFGLVFTFEENNLVTTRINKEDIL